MGGMRFELKPVAEKPKRSFVKRSKYDPILDQFLEGTADLVEVRVEGKDANYLRAQLNKRSKARGFKDKIEASLVNNVCQLEKV